MQTLGDYVLLTTAPDGRATYTAPNTRGNLACQLALPAGTVRVTATEAGLECIDAQEAAATAPWADVEAALAADFTADHLMPVPKSVAPFRFKKELKRAHGLTFVNLRAIIDASPDLSDDEKADAKDSLLVNIGFERGDPGLNQLLLAAGLDAEAIDDLFRNA